VSAVPLGLVSLSQNYEAIHNKYVGVTKKRMMALPPHRGGAAQVHWIPRAVLGTAVLVQLSPVALTTDADQTIPEGSTPR
jgi:hypothetical protein